MQASTTSKNLNYQNQKDSKRKANQNITQKNSKIPLVSTVLWWCPNQSSDLCGVNLPGLQEDHCCVQGWLQPPDVGAGPEWSASSCLEVLRLSTLTPYSVSALLP